MSAVSIPRRWVYDAAIEKSVNPDPDWRVMFEPVTGRMYFWNVVTDETTWTLTNTREMIRERTQSVLNELVKDAFFRKRQSIAGVL